MKYLLVALAGCLIVLATYKTNNTHRVTTLENGVVVQDGPMCFNPQTNLFSEGACK